MLSASLVSITLHLKTTEMSKKLLLALLFLPFSAMALADPGDTTIVQTFTFEAQLAQPGDYKSPGRQWFEFPEDDGTTYQKILMYHTLKCFDGGLTAGNLGFPCGEWDYLTYNYLFDHTGELDSTLQTHPLYLLNQQGFESTSLSLDPAFNITRYTYPNIDDWSGTDLTTSTADTPDDILHTAINSTLPRSRAQFVYPAEDLQNAGLQAGAIGQMAFFVASEAGQGGLLRIRLASAETNLNNWFDGSFAAVFAGEFAPLEDSWFEAQFHTPWEWDGTSDVLVEFLYNADEGGVPTALATSSGIGRVIASGEDDRYISFSGPSYVDVPAEAFADLEDEVTIALWVYGDPGVQPANQYIFEGRNAQNQRVLNSHLPWGNSRVYWDAGQNGGYDRIDKQASAANYAGQWNHWAFTKNAVSGEMFIYLNGELWHSGTGLHRTMEGITRFVIGAAANYTGYYDGRVDDFTVWRKALDQETIAAYMLAEIDENHPEYAQLVLNYTFNEDEGSLVIDQSGNNYHGAVIGLAGRMRHNAAERFLRGVTLAQRPIAQFTTGVFDITTSETTLDEPVLATPSALVSYVVDGYNIAVDEISYRWEANQTYGVYDEAGNFIASYDGNAQSFETVVNDELNWFGAPFEVVDRYEIGRFITPYGIGLTLGDDGWTWVFDVTDYAPLLKGMVELEAGNWQELLDLKFVFIEGTPPREVKRVDAFWKGQYNLNNFNDVVAERTFEPEPGEETFRLKTRASGHGFGQGNNCGEFCFNMHSVQVNGTPHWSWQIIEECSDNPLYPQGGTWIYDRAGWCPGAKVTTQDFELTPLVSPNEPFSVKYEITTDPFGNYRMEGQVVAYGPYNFEHDVELDEILAPSNWKIHSRVNPICNKPRIRIRNNGSAPLTTCTITFGIEGELETQQWSGNLAFGETEEVELSYTNPNFWIGDEGEGNLLFTVSVGEPNGQTDQNPFNNTGTSPFQRPPVYSYNDLNDNRLIVWVNTNNVPWENSVSIENMNGSEVWGRNYSQANTQHRDTIQLNDGCYRFHLRDTGQDGLSFFANNSGSGAARLRRVGGPNFIQFNPNFGMEIQHYFYFRTNLVGIDEHASRRQPELTVYPNPGSLSLTLQVSGAGSGAQWQMFDLTGRMVKEGRMNGVRTADRVDMLIDTAELPSGLYTITVFEPDYRRSVRWIKTE